MKNMVQKLFLCTALAALGISGIVRGAQSKADAVAQSETPGIAGRIIDGDGAPMEGVTVSAQAAGSLVTTSVYTDENGLYFFPALPAGQYSLWAQATGFHANRISVSVSGSGTQASDLTMVVLGDPRLQLTGHEWFQSLPAQDQNDERLKQILYVACTGCHSLDVALQNTFDESGWDAVIHSMENAFYNGRRPGELTPETLRWQGQIIRRHREELAAYLARVLGPESPPLDFHILDRPKGDAARAVAIEYDLPVKEKENEAAWYQGSDWMLGPSTGMHGIVGIHDVTLDEQGIAWITQARTTFETNRSIVRLDPATGAMDAISVRSPDGELMFFEQIASSPDVNGMLWMHDHEYMVRLETETGKFTAWKMPGVMKGMLNSTDVDSAGRALANSTFGFVMFDPTAPINEDVMYPGWSKYQQLIPGDGVTYGITADSQDNVWWSESYVDRVAMRDMKTGEVTEFVMHDPQYEARKSLATAADIRFYESIGGGTWGANSGSPLPYMNMPRRLSADKNGHTVWVPNWAQSNLAEININTHEVTYHELPIKVHPYKTIVDKNHNVWTDTSMSDGAFRFMPSTGSWTLFRNPSHGCGSRHVSFDDFRNELWIPCDQSNKVIRFQFRTPEQLRAAATAAGFAQ